MLAASIKDATLVETLLDRISDEDDLSQGDADGSTALHYSYAFCQVTALPEALEQLGAHTFFTV
jgi:hypothetical protein